MTTGEEFGVQPINIDTMSEEYAEARHIYLGDKDALWAAAAGAILAVVRASGIVLVKHKGFWWAVGPAADVIRDLRDNLPARIRWDCECFYRVRVLDGGILVFRDQVLLPIIAAVNKTGRVCLLTDGLTNNTDNTNDIERNNDK